MPVGALLLTAAYVPEAGSAPCQQVEGSILLGRLQKICPGEVLWGRGWYLLSTSLALWHEGFFWSLFVVGMSLPFHPTELVLLV